MNSISQNQSKHEKAPQLTLRLTVIAATMASMFGLNSASAEPLFQRSILPKPDYSRWTDNYVELGAGYLVTDSPTNKAFKFGEFTGLTDETTFGILGFNWIAQSANDDALNFRVHGQDLGLETRKMSLEGGRQGSWEGSFSAERLLRAEISPARFIFEPASLGTNQVRNLPNRPATGPDLATSRANLDTFYGNDANYTPFDIEQGRDIFKIGAKGVLSNAWTATVNYRQDLRDGSRLTGVYFNTATAAATGPGAANQVNGRNPAVVPYAIDDKTQLLDTTLAYATKTTQAQLTYSYSRYENNLDRFKVDNPNQMQTGAGGLTAATLPVAQVSLAPDNEYHQLTATGAYNFSRNTRAKAQFSYGIATQDEIFLPYNSTGFGSNGTTATYVDLPRNSLDGKVINTVANLSLLTKPLEDMSLNIGYRYRHVDNRTPRATYLYAGRDGNQAAQPDLSDNTPAITANLRTNAPMSTTEHGATVDLDYQLTAATQLRGLLEHTVTDYTLADVEQTKTNKASVDLRRTFSEVFTGNIGYAFTQRNSSSYDKNVYFRETYAREYVNGYTTSGTPATIPGNLLTNHPSMRMFMFNDYDEHRLRTLGNWVASEVTTFGASLDVFDRKYGGQDCNRSYAPTNFTTLPDTCLGTRRNLGGALTLDAQAQPDEDLFFFGFVTLQRSEIDIDQRNWSTKDTATVGGLGDVARNWSATMTQNEQTAGIGTKWQLTSKWELGGQYAYSLGKGTTKFKTAFVATPPSADMPDTESTLHTVDLFAKWAYSSNVLFRINYVYENLKITDWSFDPYSSPITNAGTLLTGQSSPKYENHVIGATVAFSIW